MVGVGGDMLSTPFLVGDSPWSGLCGGVEVMVLDMERNKKRRRMRNI